MTDHITQSEVLRALDSAFADKIQQLFNVLVNNNIVNNAQGLSFFETGLRNALQAYSDASALVKKIVKP